MNRSEIAVLRTKLRAVNIEYSALVRGTTGEDARLRMKELQVERRALMALIAEQRLDGRQHHAAVGTLAGVLAGPEIHAVYSARGTVESAAPSIEASAVSASAGDVLPL